MQLAFLAHTPRQGVHRDPATLFQTHVAGPDKHRNGSTAHRTASQGGLHCTGGVSDCKSSIHSFPVAAMASRITAAASSPTRSSRERSR
mmetsp:Transcript_39238/g.111089  ORF Transcript_39238/g.111089 Transcript_39238/m.111089 type:complete len:89 (-) Transcript_39238:119-385(-)